MKQFIFFIALLLGTFTAFSQSSDKSREKDFVNSLNAYIGKTMEKIPDIPAIAIAVIRNDQPIFIRAYGIADKEKGVKADNNTLFYIASSTKSFTALAAAMLDKEGTIKLDEPVIKYAKSISFKNPIPEKIKVRDLLTHTSGLKNYPLVFRMAYSGEVGWPDMQKVFAEATIPVDSNYGKYNYDNLGYNIYAVLLQQSTGKKWQDLLQEKIFDPLGMKHTTAYVSKALARNYNIAYPYFFRGETGTSGRSPLNKTDNNMQSAGGLFTSIADIGTWLNVNMNEGKLGGKQVIPASIIQKCQTGYTKTIRDQAPFVGDGEYGLGWQIGNYKDQKVIYHHGGFPGYSSHISFMPGQKVAVAVFTNDGVVGPRAGHMLATYVYNWWLQQEGVEDVYAKQLQELSEGYEKAKTSEIAAAADRAKRTSQLTAPLESYAGKYQNAELGTIELAVKDNTLAVKMGNINILSTPYTKKETIRVEMIPRSGEVITFKKNADGKVESLNYAGMEFIKL